MFSFHIVKSHALNHGFIFLFQNSNGKNHLIHEL